MDYFSFSTLIVSLFFIIGGFVIVNGTYLVSLFINGVLDENIEIKD